MIPHDRDLAASYYGRFFARNLNLQLLQRRPEEWRNMQAELRKQKGREQQIPSSSGEKADKAPQKRKRKEHKDDELDALFVSPNSKKAKRPTLESGDSERATKPVGNETDMQSIFHAIKATPGHEKRARSKR